MSSMSDSCVIVHTCGKLGYCDVCPNQQTAIKCILQGKDVFICLPTGSAKSLCNAALPYAFDGLYGRESSIVIVVPPLIALMKDQVSGITTLIRPYQCSLQVAVPNSKGLSATYISSKNR